MTKTDRLQWIVLVLICGFILAGIFIQPAFEARAFNKFRSPDQPVATYWDAFFSRLRITSK